MKKNLFLLCAFFACNFALWFDVSALNDRLFENVYDFSFNEETDNEDALCRTRGMIDLEAKAIRHKYPEKEQYQFVIAAIFQNEARFMKEWIEFYKMNGVDHFYMYNNKSTDDYAAVLAPYVAAGEIELFDWDGLPNQDYDSIQINAYRDALSRARGKAKWFGALDLDEYLVINQVAENPNITIREFLQIYDNLPGYGGLCFPWVFFGTSYVKRVPDNMLRIEALTLNGGKAAGGDESAIWNMGAYKSVAKVACMLDVVSPHYFTYIQGFCHAMTSFDQTQINHYWAGDMEYFENVKIPRRFLWGQCAENARAWESGMNHPTDLSNKILRFIPELRRRLHYDN